MATYAPTAPAGGGIRQAIGDGLIVTWRNLKRVPRIPELAILAIIQSIMFVLLFSFVFGGAIPLPGGGSYREFLMPGIFAQTVVFASVTTAIGMTDDLSKGLIDRFRSLPMAHSGVLAGRVLSDTLVTVLTVAVMVIVGYLVGFRITTSPLEAVVAFIVMMAFGFSFSWVAAFIGLALKEPEAVQSGGFMWMFPLAFASGVFVVPATLPGWLQDFAAHNPLTRVADAVRALTIGAYPCGDTVDTVTACTGVQDNLLWALAWAVVITLVFLPLSVRGWKRLD